MNQMPGGKILILLFILLLATFALRIFSTALPGIQTTIQKYSNRTSTTGVGFNQTPAPAGNSLSWLTQPTQTQQAQQQAPIDPSQIPQGFSLNQLSPYFRKVVFSGVSFPGYINLSLSYEVTTPVNVTGWLIQARRGAQVIPQAVNIYDSTGLAPETDIYLRAGDMLRMFPYASAIGKNFRLNKCIGALGKENRFTPLLPGYCPALYKDRSEISSFTGRCQDYIFSLSYCATPDFYSTNIPRDDYACQAYLQNNVNFKGCFDKYRGDADFLKNEIWVWTGNDRLLDDRHDRVLLFDKAGLLVSEYSY